MTFDELSNAVCRISLASTGAELKMVFKTPQQIVEFQDPQRDAS